MSSDSVGSVKRHAGTKPLCWTCIKRLAFTEYFQMALVGARLPTLRFLHPFLRFQIDAGEDFFPAENASTNRLSGSFQDTDLTQGS